MLTPKQEAFCLAYLETGNASEAYRRAYNAGAMKPETVNRTAKELIDSPKIAARIAELRAPAVDAAKLTFEEHLQRLDELGRQAQKAEQFAAAIAAETNRGKAAGFYKQEAKINLNMRSLADEIRALDAALIAETAAKAT